MNVWMKYLSVVMLVLVFPISAFSMSPVEEYFQDETVVTAALGDIGKMGREELENFITFHIICSDVNRTEINKYSCRKEQAIFEVKYTRNRSIDRINYALVVLLNYIELPSNEHVSDPVKIEAMDKLIKRYVYVKHVVSDAITKRYQVLAKIH